MRNVFSFSRLTIAAILFFACTSCQKDDAVNVPITDSNARKSSSAITFYALADGLSLDKFSTTAPEKELNTSVITGLQPGEKILGIDFRPATGQLYGLGSTSRLYVINPETGAARAIGLGTFSPLLSGNIAGFDFNPTVDRIQVVTSAGQNLRLNPETGAVVAVDGTINGQPGAMLAGAAYANNVAGATTTTLYDIDLTLQKLFKQIPPNEGTLVEVGSLGLKLPVKVALIFLLKKALPWVCLK